MKNVRLRNTCITLFVILWSLVFHYESLRFFYLQPFFRKHFDVELPKIKFLFPPAGWIMFFNVNNGFGYVEVYGLKDKQIQLLDPHEIFRTRTIMYDNVHRGIMGVAAERNNSKAFCRYLYSQFDYFDGFAVKVIYYPDVAQEPYKRFEEIKYQCVP